MFRLLPSAALCAVLITTLLADAASAQNLRVLENPAVQRGRDLVRRNCARCHSVSLRGGSFDGAAPPFRDLGDRHTPETLREVVAESVTGDHNSMPSIQLSPKDARAIEAFLTAFAHADKETRRRLSVPRCFMGQC